MQYRHDPPTKSAPVKAQARLDEPLHLMLQGVMSGDAFPVNGMLSALLVLTVRVFTGHPKRCWNLLYTYTATYPRGFFMTIGRGISLTRFVINCVAFFPKCGICITKLLCTLDTFRICYILRFDSTL